ncbi:hypothetical protein C8Q75DRAFT_376241 [Abortiporus biennis]|nr:hypothetical protein C8Q75DRAFT_376241 [Abortiporus biennis]
MMLLPRFPQEVIDMIIDHLYLDRATLSACSTTCHSFLSPARFHLFETINLDLRTTWRYKASFTNDPQDNSAVGMLRSFVQFLENTPSISTYIQTLVIYGDRCTSYSYSVARQELFTLTLQILYMVIGKLPTLKALSLRRVVLEARTPGPMKPDYPPFRSRNMRSLRLHDIRILESGDKKSTRRGLLYVLGLFRRIDSVNIANVITERHSEMSDNDAAADDPSLVFEQDIGSSNRLHINTLRQSYDESDLPFSHLFQSSIADDSLVHLIIYDLSLGSATNSFLGNATRCRQ